MIVATSGNNWTQYNRIISESISPYSVSEIKSLRDPISFNTQRLFGLYIVSQNNLVSLIYNTVTKFTQLASINFLTEEISF
jgi:hypothetical protein